jgi:predicted RND superfamily exporter protein
MGFGALIASSLIPLVHMGGLMVFAMISTSLGTLTILASVMEINKQNLYKTGNA